MKRRTEITIETDRLVLVGRTRFGAPSLGCVVCGDGVRVIALDEAAARLRVHPRTMTRIAEAAGLHFSQTSDGTTLICLVSSTARRTTAHAI